MYQPYEAIEPLLDENSVVYMDPPYLGTTEYGGLPRLDHGKFWDFVRKIGHKCYVLVSEYQAPLDIDTLMEIQTKTEIRTKEKGREDRIERVFGYGKSVAAAREFLSFRQRGLFDAE